MIILLGFTLGFVLGWVRAERRQGSRADKLQYGAAHGIAFALVALFFVIVAARTGLLAG
ncbi:MAG: hypothetical protein AAGA32_08400 [Pseudomonadota bacterium]